MGIVLNAQADAHEMQLADTYLAKGYRVRNRIRHREILCNQRWKM